MNYQVNKETVIKKQIPVEVEVKDNSIVFIASTESVDRMGDVIEQNGWDLNDFLKNPVILWGHKSDEPPIGRAVKTWIEGTKLMTEVEFASKEYDFAGTIENLVRGGFLKAMSVGFKPLEWQETEEGYRFLKNLLLEISIVSLPANQDALVQMRMKGIDVGKAIETHAVKTNRKEMATLISKSVKWKEALKTHRSNLKDLRKLLGLEEYEINDEVKAVVQTFEIVKAIVEKDNKVKADAENQRKQAETQQVTPDEFAKAMAEVLKGK